MPFYELICIVRSAALSSTVSTKEVKEVARIAGRAVLNRNGVIRNIVYMGEMQLPQRIKKHGENHVLGHYFLMRFYGAPYLVKDVGRYLALDPRTLRHNFIKLGDKLSNMTKIPGDFGVRRIR